MKYNFKKTHLHLTHAEQCLEVFKRNPENNRNSTGRPLTIYPIAREPIRIILTKVGRTRQWKLFEFVSK